MFKKLIEDIRLSKVAYLLEIIKLRDLDSKIKAFKKLDNMKISKAMGLEILDAATYDYGIKDGNGGINSSLISLCMKDYYEEYNEKIKKMFKNLDDDCKNKVVFLLSSIDNQYALDLYADLVLKYYKDSNFIPISNLYERPNNYKLLFPKLFKALKFKNYKSNILIILNDYLNAGVIPEVDIKKNKKVIQDCISKIFAEGLKFKFTNTTKALQNDKYFDIRFYLEIAVNIEYYVSNKKTSDLLKDLFSRNDNQLKLFILENYIRKGKDISILDLEKIAKDPASRYPLYDLLSAYNKADLIPKKYLTGEKIAESDLYVNFCVINTYKEVPKSLKFVEKREINNQLYYVFTFKHTYVNNIDYDTTTNYLISNAGIDKYKDKKITATFIGLSGGYNLNNIPSLVETTNNKILWSKLLDNESIDDAINRIMPSSSALKEEIFSKFSKKSREEKKNRKNLRKIEKTIEKELKKKAKAEKRQELQEDETIEDIIEEEREERKRKFKFGYILTFLLIVFVIVLIFFVECLKQPDLIGLTDSNKIKINTVKTEVLLYPEKFKEINGTDIFSQSEESYYVLLYKVKGQKNGYYHYINELVDNNYTVYYVNLNDDKNKFLYDQTNELNFSLSSDRYLKVEEGDFSFYVDGKSNILNELKTEVDSILKVKAEKEKAEKEAKAKEEAEKQAQEKKQSKESKEKAKTKTKK